MATWFRFIQIQILIGIYIIYTYTIKKIKFIRYSTHIGQNATAVYKKQFNWSKKECLEIIWNGINLTQMYCVIAIDVFA